jgi:hypothetical protein
MDVYVERAWFMTDDAHWGCEEYVATDGHDVDEPAPFQLLTCPSPPYQYSSLTYPLVREWRALASLAAWPRATQPPNHHDRSRSKHRILHQWKEATEDMLWPSHRKEPPLT